MKGEMLPPENYEGHMSPLTITKVSHRSCLVAQRLPADQ
jgi:hypothetical protein